MRPYFAERGVEIYHGDACAVLQQMPEASVHCCVTSPPYWGLRDYGVDGQLGLEPTPEEFVGKIVAVFREVRRVLADDGTLWLNLGDSYNANGRDSHGTRVGHLQGTNRASMVGADNVRPNEKKSFRRDRAAVATESHSHKAAPGLKPKDLVGIPWLVAFALRSDGWYLRQDIIWHKPNPMPESVTDRCTKAHEYIFLLSKSARYYFDGDAIKEKASENTRARLPGDKSHKGKTKYEAGDERHRTKAGLVDYASRKRAAAGSGIKNNESMDAALAVMPDNRNKRSVWTVASEPYKGAHFATFPRKLIEPCILAGCPEGGVVLDPFSGSGTTGEVARKHGRRFAGIELNAQYIELSKARFRQQTLFSDSAPLR